MVLDKEITNPQDETRQRLIEAAGRIFAEHGYRHATVRQICQEAGANIAAINYHFGDKEQLYLEALKVAHAGTCPAGAVADRGIDPGLSAEARLRLFIQGFIMDMVDCEAPEWHQKLFARELTEPSFALGIVVEQRILPQSKMLRGIVSELLGGLADEATIRRSGVSIVGQCLVYMHARPILTRLFPDLKYSAEELSLIAAHVSEFSLRALRSMRRTLEAKK